MNNHLRCIFCLNEGDIFHNIEHIVPESMGNTDDILNDSVCDKCQNYFGKKLNILYCLSLHSDSGELLPKLTVLNISSCIDSCV